MEQQPLLLSLKYQQLLQQLLQKEQTVTFIVVMDYLHDYDNDQPLRIVYKLMTYNLLLFK